MNTKNIFFISRDSNWQKYRLDIMKKLAEVYAVSVTIITTGELKEYLHNSSQVNYSICRSWLPLKWKASFFPEALAKIGNDRPDVVLCLSNLSQVTELLSLPISKLLKIRFVWWTHAYDHGTTSRFEFVRKIRKMFQLWLYKNADGIITFSNEGSGYLIANGIQSHKVICAPNTLDTDLLQEFAKATRNKHSRNEIASEFELDADQIYVLYSGRLIKEKNVEQAILAINLVKDDVPNIHLMIIGDGPDKERLEDLAEKMIEGHYSFLGPIYDDYTLAKLFTIADLFIMPGYIGLAIVHAFSFGLPVLTTNVQIHSPEIQYLHQGYNGYMVDDGDIEALAHEMKNLLTDREKLNELSNNAVRTVNEYADVNFMVSQMAYALRLDRKS